MRSRDLLGTPETSFKGRSTRTALNVRRSIWLPDCVLLGANSVMKLADTAQRTRSTQRKCLSTSCVPQQKKMRAHIYGIYRAGLVWLRNFSLRPVVATSLFSNLGLLANVVRLSTFVATHRAFSGADKLRTPRGYVIRLLVIFILSHLHPFNRNSTWLVTSRHHTSSPCILAQEKVVLWRDVTRRVALVGQHGATRTARQARHAAEARVRRSSISSKQPSNVLL